ncbi:MAG: hypothetical protein AVDCRST_MAG18-86, partial [uncultured Thermomicrobiales bacterium]
WPGLADPPVATCPTDRSRQCADRLHCAIRLSSGQSSRRSTPTRSRERGPEMDV